jgi:NTP pyrophosphatase (non-canonical NTP hydrolase)
VVVPLSFSEYQKAAGRTRSDKYQPGDKLSMTTAVLGLCGESGELADVLKKWLAHGHGLDSEAIRKELGDIMWYLAEACSCFGYHMEEIAEQNIEKLKKRYPDGFSSERSINRDDNVVRTGPVS